MKKNDRNYLIYKTREHAFNFHQSEMIRSFSDGIFNGKIKLDETDKKQTNLLNKILEFNDKSRPDYEAGKKKNKNICNDSINALYEGRELALNFFFYLCLLSRTFMTQRTAGERGGYLFNSSLPLPPASQTLRH